MRLGLQSNHESGLSAERQYYNLDTLQPTTGTTNDERRLGVLGQICLVLLGCEGFLERIYIRIIASASFAGACQHHMHQIGWIRISLPQRWRASVVFPSKAYSLQTVSVLEPRTSVTTHLANEDDGIVLPAPI
ncbi:hypothetical protein PTI98_011948 [Pleurotus ostreatus]|nr:hypothetical protein PTI98_011948 [Pleurotus ostreatus]